MFEQITAFFGNIGSAGGLIIMGIFVGTLLIVYGLIVSQRRFLHGKSFGVSWWGFMLVAVGASLLGVTSSVIVPLDGPVLS